MFFLLHGAILHDVIMFPTSEATRGLIMITAPWLASTSLLEVPSSLLEEFLELLGYHGHFFIIQNPNHQFPQPLEQGLGLYLFLPSPGSFSSIRMSKGSQ